MGSECNYTLCLRDLIKTKTEIKKKKNTLWILLCEPSLNWKRKKLRFNNSFGHHVRVLKIAFYGSDQHIPVKYC